MGLKQRRYRAGSLRAARSLFSGRLAGRAASRANNRRAQAPAPSFGLEPLEPRLLLSGTSLVGGLGEAIWIEGEDPTWETFNNHNWYENTNIDKSLLSGAGSGDGDWLTHFSTWQSSATAAYEFEVQEGGTYNWWIRLNPFENGNGGGNYYYRLNDGDWQEIDWSEAANNKIDLVDPGIDIRFIAWSYGAAFQLDPGTHTLEIELRQEGENENHGGIDVMALTNYAWAPTGIVAPDPDAPPPDPDEWFIFAAGPDPYSDESIIDMSHLLDDVAGEHGPLGRVGADFVFADGTPVKFWGVNAGYASDNPDIMERQARLYAKYGINMIRQHPVHGAIGDAIIGPDGSVSFDSDRLDDFDRWFATLKDHGIYMTWSIHYHHVVFPEQTESQGGNIPDELYNELPDRGGGKDTYGKASFVQEYIDSQWAYAEALLNHVNPYTGVAYKDDPALAIVEMRNEDSVFFHNPLGHNFVHGDDAPAHREYLREMWHDWVADNYASDAELSAAWGAGMLPNDSVNADPATQPMEMYAAWEMDADGAGNETARMGDFIRFLAEMQREDYEQYKSRLDGIGFDGVVVSTPWKAGGAAATAANLWTDDAMDAVYRHNYFGGGAGGHNIDEGTVNNDSHMHQPGSGILSSAFFQVEDKPFMMTEWTQKPPNQWKAEIAPLMAFYMMGLQGMDASYHFAGGRSYYGSGWPSMRSYVTETPHYMGQFPALTHAIYNNHFEEADIVAARRISLDDAFSGTEQLGQDFSGSAWDENEPTNTDTPIEALAIGRVTAKVGDGLDAPFTADLDQYWDQTNKTVTSVTDQLTWDYDDDVVMVRADQTQGLVGFAGGGTYDLPGFTITVDPNTEHLSLLFTALDNKPLIESENILITALGQDKNFGAEYSADGTQLLDAGSPPLMLQPVQATITVKGHELNDVNVVDVYGVPTDRQVAHNNNTFTIDGTHSTFYYQITRDPAVAAVEAEHVFYNRSAFDDASAGLSDADAVADNKQPLTPGASASHLNVTSSAAGLNGLIVDIAHVADVDALSVADFQFKTGNDADPSLWADAPAPLSLTVLAGEGVDGSDRVVLEWADNNGDGVTDPHEAVAGAWLQVTVQANQTTGLEADHVFYFGNLPGDGSGDGLVTIPDMPLSLSAMHDGANPADTNSAFDHNRDGYVNVADMLISRSRIGQSLTMLTAPAAGGGAAADVPLVDDAASTEPASIDSAEAFSTDLALASPDDGSVDLLAAALLRRNVATAPSAAEATPTSTSTLSLLEETDDPVADLLA